MSLVPFLLAVSLLSAAPVKLGEPAPDFSLRGVNGGTVTLADFHGRKDLVLLFAGDMRPAPELLVRLERLETALLVVNASNDPAGATRRQYVGEEIGPRAVLICRQGRLRRIQRVSNPDEVAGMMELWRLGKLNYTHICRRCHGDEGGSEMYQSAPSLIGIGNRKTEDEIRSRTFAAQLGPDHFVTRSYDVTKRDIDSLVMYISGL